MNFSLSAYLVEKNIVQQASIIKVIAAENAEPRSNVFALSAAKSFIVKATELIFHIVVMYAEERPIQTAIEGLSINAGSVVMTSMVISNKDTVA